MRLTLYQTLEDRENPHVVEEDGPFPCRNTNPWLGKGYYFWDTHRELGHWWGKTAYGEEKYMICEASAKMDDWCWDLHGNGAHRNEFHEILREFSSAKHIPIHKVLVPQIIEFFKSKGAFAYTSIRALSLDCIGQIHAYAVLTLQFVRHNKSFLDLYPPVQVCLIQKKALSLSNYHIVFPEHYCEQYV